MKLVSYTDNGADAYGVVQGSGIVGLSGRLSYLDLRALIAADGFAEARDYVEGRKPDMALDAVTLRPVVPNPGKIICVGLNYHDHVVETGRALTEKPALFVRFPESQIGHLQPLVKPIESDRFDYEGELALVIGKAGRRIRAEDAAAHIAGYACYNDGSVRDWQNHTTQFLAGKSFVGTGGFGPWLVTVDEIGDPGSLVLTTRLNGTVMQSTTVDKMITPIAEQIAYISTFTPLNAGDVIVTGTPGGVGAKRNPPVFLKAGDVVEVDIDRIGTLRNVVVNET